MASGKATLAVYRCKMNKCIPLDLACEFHEKHMNAKKEPTAAKQAAGPALPLPHAPQLLLGKNKT